MIRSLASLAALAATARADSCTLSGGNYYCSQVDQVQFNSVGYSGSYNKVTAMDSSSGTCSSSTFSFDGSSGLAPFDEGLSVHFRGPIELLQFAVYTKSSSDSVSSYKKREVEDAAVLGQPENNHHVHKRALVTKYEEITAYVTVDANGQTVTSSSTSTVTSSTATTSSSSEDIQLANSVLNYNYNHQDESSATGPSTISTTYAAASTTSASASTSSSAASSTATGEWSQIASYDADSASASGLVFLNNLGGSGSGVWDSAFGNSLSYMASDGQSSSSSSQVLSKTTVPSGSEFIIFADTECTTSTCGYSRDGTVAYEGFAGDEKIFVFEFTMPTESSVSSSTYNYDMPAIWLLNAQIPRTLQYGNADCSCWETGCGEFDLFEVLTAGESRMLATIHDGNSAGCSDYFARPTSSSMKAAVIFSGSTVTLTKLDDSVSFDSALSDSTVDAWISATTSNSAIVNV